MAEPIIPTEAISSPIEAKTPHGQPDTLHTPEDAKPVDLLIVFGQGPVKPLLLEQDLDKDPTGKLRADWEAFKKDPLHSKEPDFRVLNTKSHLSDKGEELNPFLRELTGKSEAEIDAKMAEWQKLGRFGLNRWGRQNALATGYALVSGYSEKAILSGGETKPDWAKDILSPQRLEAMGSEAQLMRDIIIRTFGESYKRAHGGKSIDESLILEDRSTNTLENFANTVNLNPEVLDSQSTGGLAAGFHAKRTERIAYLFTGNDQIKSDSSQDLLQERLDKKNERRRDLTVIDLKTGEAKPVGNKDTYTKIIDWMSDPKNKDANTRSANETAFDEALHDPDMLTNWLGYIGFVDNPRVLQLTVERLSSDPSFTAPAAEAFKLAGIDFAELSKSDIRSLPQSQFMEIADKLKILMTPEFRKKVVLPSAQV